MTRLGQNYTVELDKGTAYFTNYNNGIFELDPFEVPPGSYHFAFILKIKGADYPYPVSIKVVQLPPGFYVDASNNLVAIEFNATEEAPSIISSQSKPKASIVGNSI